MSDLSWLSKLMKPIHEKTRQGISLSQAEMMFCLLEKMFLVNWSPQGGFRLLYKRSKLQHPIRKILIIQLTSIGDVVYSTPAIQGLRERFPHSTIKFLVEPPSHEVITGNPYLDEVIVFRREDMIRPLQKDPGLLRRTIKDLAHFVSRLKDERFDIVINFHAAPRSAYLAHLVAEKNLTGITVDSFGRPLLTGNLWILYKHYITCNRLLQSLNWLNLVELYLRIAGVSPKERTTLVTWGEEADTRAEDLLRGIGKKEVLVGIFPGGNFPHRRWGPKQFACLADKIQEIKGHRVVMLGARGEAGIVEEIINGMRTKPINMCGKTSLKTLCSIISRMKLFVTNDSGPMHLAGACRTRTIAICGPTRTGPFGYEGHFLVQARLSCVGCGPTFSCDKRTCMDRITPDAVFELFRYMDGQRSTLPHFDSIRVFTSGTTPPGPLFNYFPVERDIERRAALNLIGISALTLWIEENRKMGYEDWEIDIRDALWEMERHYTKKALSKGFRDALRIVDSWLERHKEILEVLRLIQDTCDLHMRKDLVDRFNRLDRLTNKGIHRLLTIFNLLYPKRDNEEDLSYRISLNEKKRQACEKIREFLEGGLRHLQGRGGQ